MTEFRTNADTRRAPRRVITIDLLGDDFLDTVKSGDPISIAEVVRDLHRNVGQPDQSFSERQIYEAARDRLASELAAVDKTDIEAATEKLEDVLKAA